MFNIVLCTHSFTNKVLSKRSQFSVGWLCTYCSSYCLFDVYVVHLALYETTTYRRKIKNILITNNICSLY